MWHTLLPCLSRPSLGGRAQLLRAHAQRSAQTKRGARALNRTGGGDPGTNGGGGDYLNLKHCAIGPHEVGGRERPSLL